MRNTRRALLKSVEAIGSLAISGGLSAASTSEPAQEGKLPTPSGPTAVRCVVTGQTKSGKSVIVSQAPVPPVTVALMPGYEFYRLWGNDDHPVLPSDGTPTEQPQWFPPKHGFRFAMFTVPPATTVRTGPAPTSAEVEEVRQKLPGLLEVQELDHPGMHTTDSVDFDVVVFGEVVLELDDGVEALLKPGDCVVQNGTRHAWRNRSAEKCAIASCLIGAERKRFSSPTGGESK
jgi:mannose-6-phosphate isomerase-like protein (cupin superfamily)